MGGAAPPDRLTWERVSPFLGGLRLGAFIHLDEVGSTNGYARSLSLDEGCPPPEGAAVVIAESQTEGRGRLGRAWVTCPGKSIALSVLIRRDADSGEDPLLALAAACFVAQAIESCCCVSAMIKWPNDVVAEGKKICGILAETVRRPGADDRLIVGIGINANLDEIDFPPSIRGVATSLKLILGAAVDRGRVVAETLRALIDGLATRACERFANGSPLREYYDAHCVDIGREVVATHGGESLRAVALGISEGGGLIVELPGGGRRELYSGEASIRGVCGYV